MEQPPNLFHMLSLTSPRGTHHPSIVTCTPQIRPTILKTTKQLTFEITKQGGTVGINNNSSIYLPFLHHYPHKITYTTDAPISFYAYYEYSYPEEPYHIHVKHYTLPTIHRKTYTAPLISTDGLQLNKEGTNSFIIHDMKRLYTSAIEIIVLSPTQANTTLQHTTLADLTHKDNISITTNYIQYSQHCRTHYCPHTFQNIENPLNILNNWGTYHKQAFEYYQKLMLYPEDV